MNWLRICLAALSATLTYFVLGTVVFGLLPQVREEFRKYPAVYRNQEGIQGAMPIGMAAMFLSIFVLAIIYAMTYRGGAGAGEGACFGALIGLFAVGAFVVHNYANLNIGVKITMQQCLSYLVIWTIVGIVIGLVYKPAHP